MVSCFVTMVLSAALGQQAPAESAWLKSIPTDVDIVARIRPLAKGQADLIAMIKAMSPTLGEHAEPVLMAGGPMLTVLFGEEAVANTIIGVAKLPKPGEPPAWAALIKSENYAATLKNVSHIDDVKPKSLSGYDSFETAQGQTFYAIKGAGFVALGPNEELIKAMVKPSASIDSKLTGDLKAKFFAGDLGIYVNVAGIESRFGEQIDKMKSDLIANVEQAGTMMNNKMGDTLKDSVEGLFNAIKTGESLAINIDVSAEGLTLGGLATLKPDIAASRTAVPKLGKGEMLGRLPADATTYVYMNLDPSTMVGFQKLGMAFMTGGDKPSPELQKALDQQREIAGMETYTSSTTSGFPTTLNVTAPTDPQKAVEISTTVLKTIATPDGFIKSVTIDPTTQNYKGYTLYHATTNMNLEKMVTPALPLEGLKKQFGDGATSSWYGTNGKLVISVAAKTWDDAKTQIDALIDGTNSVASAASFKDLRGKLPEQASALLFMSAQGLVKQMATQMAMVTGGAAKLPSDMPKDVALLGIGVVALPNGFSFTFVLPSNVGPVFEKGLAPIIQGMQGGVINQ